jgi:hypothetical protein
LSVVGNAPIFVGRDAFAVCFKRDISRAARPQRKSASADLRLSGADIG